MKEEMNISSRTDQFKSILNQTLVTGLDNASLDLEDAMQQICNLLISVRERNSNVYIVGNGGSAGVSAHAVTDFFNMCNLKASTLHESSLLTCMANDYGYENAFSRMLSNSVRPEDVVITISSSGKSMNIRNAAKVSSEKGCVVITLSGFDKENPLRSMGNFNFWLDSNDYGMVEIGHQFLLHNMSDRIRLISSN